MLKKILTGVCLLVLPIVSWTQKGIDVSRFQDTINWSRVAKNTSIEFAYIKATEGASIRDKMYKYNIKKAREAGLLVGSYHVYSSKTTAYQQFANFKAVAAKKKQDLVPVLDIEGHHSGRLNMQRVDKLLELMEREYGAKPMIYTSEKVYTEHFAGKKYSRYHIFVAKYEGRPVIRYTLWQHSRTGRIPGIAGDVDLDRFHAIHSLHDLRLKRPKADKQAAQPSGTAAAAADTATAPKGK